jgi:hypothetical protein
MRVTQSCRTRRSLVPMAGVGNMLNWELFNSWYEEEFLARGNKAVEGKLPACGGCARSLVMRARLSVHVARLPVSLCHTYRILLCCRRAGT